MKYDSTVFLLLRQLRPLQWVKNILLFAALLFSFQLSNLDAVLLSLYGFIMFSFTASSVYILNDYHDREADRNHPVKRYRPMASGALSPTLAIAVGILLLSTAFISAFFINKLFLLVIVLYFITNILYSTYLKHVVIIDMMVIAFGFVLRAIAGALIINVPFTPWFLLCTMLLSLFLAIGKRRNELVLYLENKQAHRKVLDHYSLPFLDQLTSIVTSATIVSYAVFTFTAGHTVHLMWTIPFVIYGIFRYLYLIQIKNEGGAPEQVLFRDKHILVTVILYGVSVLIILTFLN